MANTITIITKHNNTSGSVPPALAEGELAINTHPSDLTLYVGTSAGGVASLNISGGGGGGGGGVSSSYAVTSSYASVAGSVSNGFSFLNPIVTQSFTMSGTVLTYRKDLGSINGQVTLSLSDAQIFGMVLTGDVSFSYTNVPAQSNYIFEVTQDGTGGRRIQFPPASLYPYGIQLSGTLSPGEKDIYTIYTDGTSFYTTNFLFYSNSSASYAVTSSYSSHLGGFPQTGWLASSGSATRTPFDTTTVSTQNLAERVKALIDDLLAGGLLSS